MLIDILSRGPQLYSTQSLLKAAQVRGHQVQIIDHSKCHLLVGDQKDIQIYYEGQVHKLPQAVIPRIGASITSHGADVIRHLQQSGKVYCLTGAEALLLARDKFRSLQLLAGAGLPVPRSLVYGQIANPSLAIEFLGGFPMVFKLMESTHGAGVILIHSLSALETTIQHFSRTGVRFMLQEFIEEAGGADIRVIVVGKEVVAFMERQAQDGEFRSNLHRGASARTIPLSVDEMQMAIKAVQILGLEVAGVDLLRSHRGPLIIEVNASPGLEGIERVTGINVAAQMIKWVEKRVHDKRMGT